MTKHPKNGDDQGTAGNADAPAPRRCAWCRRPLPTPTRLGRPRRYCKQSCRQRDYEARRRAREHGIDEHDLIVARATLDQLRDELYVLSCAVDDAQRDLADASTAVELRDIVRSLLDAARPACAFDPTLAAERF